MANLIMKEAMATDFETKKIHLVRCVDKVTIGAIMDRFRMRWGAHLLLSWVICAGVKGSIDVRSLSIDNKST